MRLIKPSSAEMNKNAIPWKYKQMKLKKRKLVRRFSLCTKDETQLSCLEIEFSGVRKSLVQLKIVSNMHDPV